MVELQVKSIYKLLSMALPSMIQRRSGNIVLVSSIWGQIGASCEVLYSMVKGAQNSYVKALAKRGFIKWNKSERGGARCN